MNALVIREKIKLHEKKPEKKPEKKLCGFSYDKNMANFEGFH